MTDAKGWSFSDPSRPTVCVQGLGFVGVPMCAAVAAAADDQGRPRFNVIGVDRDDAAGREKAQALAEGRCPVRSADPSLPAALAAAHAAGNLTATTDLAAYQDAQVVVIDLPLDVDGLPDDPQVDLDFLRRAIGEVADRVPAGCLLVLETTVPPGTTRKVVVPEVAQRLQARGLDPQAVSVAYCFERVMPGAGYFDSVRRIWRAYAGATPQAAARCREFLEAFVDVAAYPLSELASTDAAELTKVLENTFRAVNIALLDEWTRFGAALGVDLFEVGDAIRVRPTHRNLARPGLGVGGYCLTKDPMMGKVSARQLLGDAGFEFPISEAAVGINRRMPGWTVGLLREALGGLDGRRVLVLGAAYRPGVGDTRETPVGALLSAVVAEGAQAEAYDPLVEDWPEAPAPLRPTLPPADGLDAVVLAVGHDEVRSLDLVAWAGGHRPLVLDADGVLDPTRHAQLREAGFEVRAVGRASGGER